MSNLLLLGDTTTLLPFFLERTIIYACWYATLFWLPVRGIAALIDYHRGIGVGVYDEALADPSYRIGMDILPPL